ncbi:hypothetical protein [Sphingomonas sp.]|uniref:hypothetical protein n=1 Tax=Sphingomonas sp. TaxID=28214 RepID=UPI003AFFB348
MIAIAAGVLVTSALAVVPASGASTERQARVARRVATGARPALAFTPAAADPRLAAVFARGGMDTSGFRFTPADTRNANRAVTVAVRARANRPDTVARTVATTAAVGLAPIAYNLGVAVGWRRFGIAGEARRVDMAGQPGGREAADVTVSYAGDRMIGRVKAGADRPFESVAPRIDGDRSYSLDLGGSYRVTGNLDVTAGLRYRTERDRLVRLDEQRRNSQAVYVGTAFRF